MRSRVVTALVTVLAAVMVLSGPTARADQDDSTHATWQGAVVQSQTVGHTTGPDPTTASSEDQVVIEPVCVSGVSASVLCTEVPCVGDDEVGSAYNVYVNGELTDETWCATEPGDSTPPQVTPAMVLRAFRSYSWPASDLVVQPPNGRTAVNLDTFFFTEDTAPVTHVVTLLGRRVEVEATPSSYTWVWGDGGEVTTAGPGGPYPGGDVVHRYARTGEVSARLDTTYGGRYRVDGGPWIGIPGTLTVAGEAQTLQVVEVQPTLVAP